MGDPLLDSWWMWGSYSSPGPQEASPWATTNPGYQTGVELRGSPGTRYGTRPDLYGFQAFDNADINGYTNLPSAMWEQPGWVEAPIKTQPWTGLPGGAMQPDAEWLARFAPVGPAGVSSISGNPWRNVILGQNLGAKTPEALKKSLYSGDVYLGSDPYYTDQGRRLYMVYRDGKYELTDTPASQAGAPTIGDLGAIFEDAWRQKILRREEMQGDGSYGINLGLTSSKVREVEGQYGGGLRFNRPTFLLNELLNEWWLRRQEGYKPWQAFDPNSGRYQGWTRPASPQSQPMLPQQPAVPEVKPPEQTFATGQFQSQRSGEAQTTSPTTFAQQTPGVQEGQGKTRAGRFLDQLVSSRLGRR